MTLHTVMRAALRRVSTIGVFCTFVLMTSSPCRAGDGCPDWLHTFGDNPLGGYVAVFAVYDDGLGGGPALYAGGGFTNIGGTPANRIARWDGVSWTPLGTGFPNPVHALAVYDDGTGAKLYAGGAFANAGGVAVQNIASWNGTTWAPLGVGVNGTVQWLTTYNDGTGTKLYAGGVFNSAGNMLVNNIASWNGTMWSPLDGGVTGGFGPRVRALTTHNDGTGTKLYAAGNFAMAGTTPASHIASWNGTTWSALGAGIDGVGGIEVAVLKSFDDGSGSKLYVGGAFTIAGGNPALRMARWDGSTWSAMGAGMNNFVTALGEYDDGTGHGARLYAGGAFTLADGQPAAKIARWDGTTWTTLESGFDSQAVIFALQSFDDGAGNGTAFFVGGAFTSSADGDSWITKYQGCPVGDPADLNGDGAVNAADLGVLLGGWGSGGATDINGDGTTNSTDLAILLGAWTR